MTDLADQSTGHTHSAPPEVVVAPAVGCPAVIGVPTFVVGSLALGLVLVGYVPATAAAASIPIVSTATGLGLVIAAVRAASLAQNCGRGGVRHLRRLLAQLRRAGARAHPQLVDSDRWQSPAVGRAPGGLRRGLGGPPDQAPRSCWIFLIKARYHDILDKVR